MYSHYPFDQNAKSSDTKCFTLSIKCFCILIERVMTVYRNYDVIAFKSCIQIFTLFSIDFLLISKFTNKLRLNKFLGTNTTEANKSLKTDANGAH